MNKYDIFILVVELKSFSKSAEVLKTSVSAVSKAISKLEKELGIILIDRKYKKVSFSNPGHALNLQKRLNRLFNCTDFSVYKLTQGEKV